jgi:hypothetical protein
METEPNNMQNFEGGGPTPHTAHTELDSPDLPEQTQKDNQRERLRQAMLEKLKKYA